MAKSKKRAAKATAQSKAAFARSFPKGTPASAIVAAGVKQGMKLSKRYVWNARSSSGSPRGKRKAASRATSPRKQSMIARRPTERRAPAPDAVKLFDAWLDVALERGRLAADAIVESARQRLADVRRTLNK